MKWGNIVFYKYMKKTGFNIQQIFTESFLFQDTVLDPGDGV